jgi:type VI secretion system protein VasJ
MGFWLELNQSPPSDGGQTLVPPPPDGLKAQMESYAGAGNWLGLVQFADENVAEFILWLDPHRYIAKAMDELGGAYEEAKRALLVELALVLQRAPELPTLLFNDGTPFADEDTKAFIEAEVLPVLGSGGGGGGGGMTKQSAVDKAIGEARALFANGSLPEALTVLRKAAAVAATPVDRFRGKLAAGKLCLQAQQFAVARAQLDGLDRMVEEHKLEQWDPDLCADLYAALYAAHRGANQGYEVTPEMRARELAAFDKLCQLDPGEAIKLQAG